MNYKIGIVCAGDQEVAPFIPMIEECVLSKKAMLTFYTGKIGGTEIVTLYSGVCKTNAAIATQLLIDTFHCDIIINAGTAGGMSPDIKLFDTVISTESLYWDMAEDILTEFHPWMEDIYFKADYKLIEEFKNCAEKHMISNVYFGRMISGERFIENDFREEINEKYSPLSVDMETASIAHVCYVNKIPYIAVRTITDTEEHCGEDEFDANCEKASKIAADIVALFIKEIA